MIWSNVSMAEYFSVMLESKIRTHYLEAQISLLLVLKAKTGLKRRGVTVPLYCNCTITIYMWLDRATRCFMAHNTSYA